MSKKLTEEQKQKIREKEDKSFKAWQKRCIKYIKKQQKVQITTYESQNNTDENGTVISEGHSSVDITVILPFALSWFHIRRLVSSWVSFNLSLIKALFGHKHDLREVWLFERPHLDMKAWFWVFSSLDSFRWDCAEEKLYPLDQRKGKWRWTSQAMQAIKDESERLTKDELEKFVSEDHERWGYGVWVSKSDNTVVVFDETVYKYDLKDGWSDQYLEVLADWWWYFGNSNASRSFSKFVFVKDDE